MRKDAKGYGVLGSDLSHHEKTLDFHREIEARLVIPHPRGDGSALTLVTNLLSDGTYTFRVEDQNRQAVKEVRGDIIQETEKDGSNPVC